MAAFEDLCALLSHLSKHQHYVNHMFCIQPHHTLSFMCPISLDRDLLFVKWSMESPCGHGVKMLNVVCMRVLPGACRPIIYNDRGSFYYFLHGYIRRRHWFFIFRRLSPFSLSGTSKKKKKTKNKEKKKKEEREEEVVHIYDKESIFECKG